MGKHPAKDAVAGAIVAQRAAGSRGSPAGRPATPAAGSAVGSSAESPARSPAGSPARRVPQQGPESRRAGLRDALDAALAGAVLSSRDRQFLARLVKWDKRNAASVASLLWRARLVGRAEAALTAGQLEIVLGALTDAVAYRESGAKSIGCWDCENFPGGRCAEHAKDLDLAQACMELASVLAAGHGPAADLPQPTDIVGQRQYSTVAS
jgi:hypothetical protein